MSIWRAREAQNEVKILLGVTFEASCFGQKVSPAGSGFRPNALLSSLVTKPPGPRPNPGGTGGETPAYVTRLDVLIRDAGFPISVPCER